jgi:broad specificity phosphatase PhoE
MGAQQKAEALCGANGGSSLRLRVVSEASLGRQQLVVLAKHGTPGLDHTAPAREWALSRRGEADALLLADRLKPYAPFQLVSSCEPKARRTAELVAAALQMTLRVVDDLREIDRPVLPIMEPARHRAVNRPIFVDPDRAVLGSESASAAANRFMVAILLEAERCAPAHLVAISHGTVIALLVALHNAVDGFHFWSEFGCGEFVVLEFPSFRLVRPSLNVG